ncbi:MAG: hypothetical protein R3F62_06010 [Planctomycetota bacterium]
MGDQALRSLERSWRGGDPAARQQLAEGLLRRGDWRAATEVFAEHPPAHPGEAEVCGRAWARRLAGLRPQGRVAGLRAYGRLVGWCGPELRYGALYTRERAELRVLDRARDVLLADGLPLRGVTGVATDRGELYVSYDLGWRTWGRWRLDPDELPQVVSHVPFAARWEALPGAGARLCGVWDGAFLSQGPEGTTLSVSGGQRRIPSGAALGGAPLRAAWWEPGHLALLDLETGTQVRYDLDASWRRVDPVAAASTGGDPRATCFAATGEVVCGRAVVDLARGEVRFARRSLSDGLAPRLDGQGALLGLSGERLERLPLGPATPLVSWAGVPSGADELAEPPEVTGWWHPRADVAAVRAGGSGWVGAPGERPSLRLPLGAAPLGWTPDGGRLLVARGGGDAQALELWEAP